MCCCDWNIRKQAYSVDRVNSHSNKRRGLVWWWQQKYDSQSGHWLWVMLLMCTRQPPVCEWEWRLQQQETFSQSEHCAMFDVYRVAGGWVETAAARNVLTVRTLRNLWCVQCSHLCVSVSGDFNSKQRTHNQDTVQYVWPVISCWEWRLQHQEPCTQDTVHPLACVQSLRISVAAYSGHCLAFSLRTVLEDFCCSCAEDLGGSRPLGASDGVF